MEKHDKCKFDKKTYDRQYVKDNYKRITVLIRNDDPTLKMLEKYKISNPDKSINTIVIDALWDYLHFQLSKIEKAEKKAKKV